ncbi:MAG: SAM-dependent methyltransferase [Acidimicrobiales bacterium]
MTDQQSNHSRGEAEPVDIAGDVAHPARVYDYVLGGDGHFAADRKAADDAAAAGRGGLDHARAAVHANQAFLLRTVTYLVRDLGVRQLLNVGASIPTAVDTVHELAQRIAPDSRIVYVNDDPVVLAHAHTLRRSGPQGAADYINADPRDPRTILEQAEHTLDLGQPTGVILASILHHICDTNDPHKIVARYVDALAPASYLLASHLTSDIMTDEVTEAARRLNEQPGFTLVPRSQAEIARFFEGLDLVPPGLVLIDRWHSPAVPPPAPHPLPIPFYGAIGRKSEQR